MMELINVGDAVQFHPNVNRDPYLGNCVVCGRKVGNNPKTIYFDWDARISLDVNPDQGFRFAVGSECAARFSADVFVGA